MPDTKNKLFLYEALELRAEYDARVKTLKDCLPETKQNRERLSLEVLTTLQSGKAIHHKPKTAQHIKQFSTTTFMAPRLPPCCQN